MDETVRKCDACGKVIPYGHELYRLGVTYWKDAGPNLTAYGSKTIVDCNRQGDCCSSECAAALLRLRLVQFEGKLQPFKE